MTEPASSPSAEPEDALELAADEAIAVCDGDVRAALIATLVYNTFLERKLDMMRGKISSGYTRQKITPPRQASEKVNEWREISSDVADAPKSTDGA